MQGCSLWKLSFINMKNFIFKIGIVLLFAIALNSCEKEYLDINVTNVQEENILEESSEGKIVLGKQLEDPYSL